MCLPLCAWGDQKKADGEKGFTLIELIVVTFLIGIMLSMSIPSLRDTFFTDPLKTTTRKIIGLVVGVRELAARSREPYLLHISQVENRIWYEREVDGQEEKKTDIFETTTDSLAKRELKFPESVKIAGVWMGNDDGTAQDNSVIWISKQGYMHETVIRVEDGNGNHLNVQFYPFLDPALVSDQVVPF